LEYWEQVVIHDYREDLPKIRVPLAIIYAHPGSLFDERVALYIKSRVPQGNLYPVENATHLSIVLRSKAIHKIINVF